MKIVREHIEFERGLEPMDAMSLGDVEGRKIQKVLRQSTPIEIYDNEIIDDDQYPFLIHVIPTGAPENHSMEIRYYNGQSKWERLFFEKYKIHLINALGKNDNDFRYANRIIDSEGNILYDEIS